MVEQSYSYEVFGRDNMQISALNDDRSLASMLGEVSWDFMEVYSHVSMFVESFDRLETYL